MRLTNANSQIITQYDGDWKDEETGKYLYFNDRLGSYWWESKCKLFF